MDLNANYGDMEIVLSSKDGVALKPFPVRVIVGYVGSLLALLFILMKTFIGSSSLWIVILFCFAWIALTILLCAFDKTKRMNLSLIPTITRYMSYSHRHVSTRTTSNAMPFYQISGINRIRENGLIEWSDGTFGYMYRVTGSASILLFDDDRTSIIDRVDSFFRKMDTNVEVGYITTKEAQKVYWQVANLKNVYDNMESDDPDLRECAEEQCRILTDYVGGSFRSIHQYMYLKAYNEESLTIAKNVLQSEVENSYYMMKRCDPLDREDIYELLRTIYRQSGN